MTDLPATDLPSTEQDFQQLQHLLEEAASTRDKYRLHRQLQQMQEQRKRGVDITAAWQTWHEALLATQALTERRRQMVPDFSYPDLPVSARADEIAELLVKHQVIVVAGETGSG